MKRKLPAIALLLCMSLCLYACDDEEYYDASSCEEGSYEDDFCEEGSYEDGSYEDDPYGYPSDDPYSYYSDGGNYEAFDAKDYPFDTSLGSAKELDGKIAVISMFVNDQTTSWDFDNETDQSLSELAFNNLKIASEYLEDTCKEYGRDVDLIYDWYEIPELAYELTVDTDYRTVDSGNQIDDVMSQSIQSEIPTESILEKVGASQVIYMAYFNTPVTNMITSCTHSYYKGKSYPYEICYMFMCCDNVKEAPAPFAHEMLHTFGAPDLYTVDEDGDWGINQEYVDYAEKTGLNDIMRICDPGNGVYDYNKIHNEITDISAYYVGLTDHSDIVDEWGFLPSEHVGQN